MACIFEMAVCQQHRPFCARMQALARTLSIDVRHTPGHVEVYVVDHVLHPLAPDAAPSAGAAADAAAITPAPRVVERARVHAAVHVPRVLVSLVHSRCAREVAVLQLRSVRAAAECDDQGTYRAVVQLHELRAASSDPHAKFVDALSVPVRRARTEQVCPFPHQAALRHDATPSCLRATSPTRVHVRRGGGGTVTRRQWSCGSQGV